MLKVGSKRKRTRKQVDDVKDVEKELKSNRQSFLLEVKRLREGLSRKSNVTYRASCSEQS